MTLILKTCLLFLSGMVHSGCQDQEATLQSSYPFPYSLSEPDHTVELDLNLASSELGLTPEQTYRNLLVQIFLLLP